MPSVRRLVVGVTSSTRNSIGLPTRLPWAIYIDPQYRLPGYAAIEYYHPVFLYESLWSLGNVGILLWLSRRYEERLKPGDIFLTYLFIYPMGRFLIEFLRLDSAQVAGLNANQNIMLIVALLAGGTLIWRHKFQKSAPGSLDDSGEADTQPPMLMDDHSTDQVTEPNEEEGTPEGEEEPGESPEN